MARWTIAWVLMSAAALAEEPDQVLIAVQVPVGGGQISAVSHALEWSATQLPGGGMRVALRVPVASFDSGHAAFDAAVRAALQSKQFPFAELEGTLQGARFEGTLTLRGVSQKISMPVRAVRSAGQLVVDASFVFELSPFGISLPSVGPRAGVDFIARVSTRPEAVLAGGALGSN